MLLRSATLGLLTLALPAKAHDDSFSFSRLDVSEGALEVSLRVQALSIVEVLPWMDGDGDLLIDEAEAADRPEELGRYVLDHYRLSIDETALRPARFPSIRLDPAALVPGSWLELRWTLEPPADGEELRLEVDLFAETSPGHLEYTEITWWGTELPVAVLGQAQASWSFRPPSRLEAARAAVRSGCEQTWAWGAALLAAALACTSLGRLQVLLLALAGAIVGGAWVGLGAPGPPAKPVELAALLGGAYLASDLALFPRPRAPRAEALCFGLLVGLAWGLEAGPRLAGEVRTGLRGGVEVATVVAACALIATVAAFLSNERRRRPVAAGVALVGLAVFARVAFDR